ncbi:MAG: FtsX-like permease family protein [Reyranellaceae bacterium]
MSARPRRVRDMRRIFGLALADAKHEWRSTLCLVLALAAVLAPLLILFGLRYGVIQTLADRMTRDPRNLEIVPIGAGRFDAAFFEKVAGWPDVAFLIPKTRSISATIDIFQDGGSPVPAEMIPTKTGDPLLESHPIPASDRQVVLTADAARKIGNVKPGAKINGVIGRTINGRTENVRLMLEVIAVLPDATLNGEAVFLPLKTLADTESFREGFAVPEFKAEGPPRPDVARLYAGFRLYGRTIYDIPVLRDRLLAQRIETFTRAAEVEQIQSLDRNLGLLFWLIAGIGAAGFLLSLGVSLWGAVERKRRDLALLRLLGFRARATVFFPVTQAALVACLGIGLGWAAQAGAAVVLDRYFASSVGAGEAVSRLLPVHLASAAGTTLLCALLAAAIASARAARIDPSEGLREL